MILDHKGDEVPQVPKQEAHKFGKFVVPPDAHIKGLAGVVNDENPDKRPISRDSQLKRRS